MSHLRERRVEDQLRMGAHVPPGDARRLRVRLDVVELDRVEAGAGALAGAGGELAQDEVALAPVVVEVEPVLVREAAAERLANQAVAVGPVELDVLVVVGAEVLGSAGREVTDRTAAT